MPRKEFEALVEEGFARLPKQFRRKIKNVAFLVEQEPSVQMHTDMGLTDGETLLGLYRGIPNTARGAEYGVGPTLPDTIVLYQASIEEEARVLLSHKKRSFLNAKEKERVYREAVREVVADTVWHEVAHYFGYGEEEVARREHERNNKLTNLRL